MWASRSSSIDAFECAGTILASTLVPSCKLVPSARRVMLPVSSHGTACSYARSAFPRNVHERPY